MALFGDLLNMDIESQSQDLWGFYERCGYKVKRGVQRLEARQADEDLADLLSMQVGAPILYKERTLFSEDGTPIEFLYCFNRGDMYSITVSLLR
jgi:GntR family transcriptional regulator